MEIVAEEQTVAGVGTVWFQWHPFPAVRLSIGIPKASGADSQEFPDPFMFNELRLQERNGKTPFRVSRILRNQVFADHHVVDVIEGHVSGTLEIGNPAPTEKVIFHIPNFPFFTGGRPLDDGATSEEEFEARNRPGPFVGSIAELRIQIDPVPNSSDLTTGLSLVGGYAITHIATVSRLDSEPVAYEQVARIEEILQWWLSLLRSERTAAMLSVGVHGDEVVWERWGAANVSPWVRQRSWLPGPLALSMAGNTGTVLPGGVAPVSLSDTQVLLRNLASALGDAERRDAMLNVLDWYTQSVSSGHLATVVLLAQAGLELTSWLRLRDIGVSEDGFEKLTAEDQVRLALKDASIPFEVPFYLAILGTATGNPPRQPALDGPAAITQIRNNAVHPRKDDRLSASEVVAEGSQLAVWYLELLILYYLGYEGQIRMRGSIFPAPAPWAAS